MIQTFTLDLDFTAKNTEKEQKNALLQFAEPSKTTIANILNFSRNLEIKQSKLINSIELLKS